MAKNILDKELNTYEAHKKELLGSNENKYVLIKGEKVEGVFNNEQDAISKGYELYLNEPFLVKKIQAVDDVLNFLSFNLAL